MWNREEKSEKEILTLLQSIQCEMNGGGGREEGEGERGKLKMRGSERKLEAEICQIVKCFKI